MHTNFFNIIRFFKSKTHRSCIYPNFITGSCWFWIQIRKIQFVNPNVNNHIFQNMSRNLTLSKEIKRFNEIASIKRIEFIKKKLIKKTSLGIWHLISITCEEADLQKTENSLIKLQILFIINSLIPFLSDLDQLHF